MTLKNDEKSEEKFTWRFKIDIRNSTSFDLRIENLKNLYFNGLLLIKVYNVCAKKRRGEGVILGVSSEELYFVTLECDAKFEEKLRFGKWHEEFYKFSPEHTKVSKLGLSLGTFIQSRKHMSLKIIGELCVMTMKNDAKIERELTCQFKIDMRNLKNFDVSTRKSQKFTLWWAVFDQSI